MGRGHRTGPYNLSTGLTQGTVSVYTIHLGYLVILTLVYTTYHKTSRVSNYFRSFSGFELRSKRPFY